MKYCIFSAQYLPKTGGVERYTYNLAKCLIQNGHEVVIVTSMRDNLPIYEQDKDGIIIHRVKTLLALNGTFPISLCGHGYLSSVLSNEKIDRIIIQTRLYTLSILGMDYANRNNIPFITIEHGTGYIGSRNKLVNYFEIIYEKILIRAAQKRCNTFCTVSQAGMYWLDTIGIKGSKVLYNSVDIDALEAEIQNSKHNYRTEYEIDNNATIVSYVGRVIEEKGIFKLIEAIKASDISVHLFIAGDGSDAHRIIESDRIHYIGNLSHCDAIALINQSNIFCLPSEYAEGLPTSVLEALVCKTYVITTKAGGSKEIITSDEYGCILDEVSSNSIKNAIEFGRLNKSLIDNIVKNSYDKVSRDYIWQRNVERLEELKW